MQLRINVEHQLEKVMESISKFFKEENDFLYKKREAKNQVKSVANLIVKLALSDEQIADTLELPLSFVQNVRQSLNQ